MARKNEQIYVDLNVFVGGMGLLGVATSFKPPVVELKGVDSYSSSAGDIKCFYGAVENMECEFSLGQHNPLVYEEMAKMGEGTFILKASASQCKIGETNSVEYEVRGQVSTIEDPESKRGEKVAQTVKMGSVSYYKKSIDGKVVCEIDKINGIVKPDGKTDLLEKSRNFLNG